MKTLKKACPCKKDSVQILCMSNGSMILKFPILESLWKVKVPNKPSKPFCTSMDCIFVCVLYICIYIYTSLFH